MNDAVVILCCSSWVVINFLLLYVQKHFMLPNFSQLYFQLYDPKWGHNLLVQKLWITGAGANVGKPGKVGPCLDTRVQLHRRESGVQSHSSGTIDENNV